MASALATRNMRSYAMIPRWVIGIGILAFVALVGQWSTDQTAERYNLGFRVQPQGTQMVINWVQPAGLGWDRMLRPGDVLLTADNNPVSINDDPAKLSQATTVTFRSGTTVRSASSLNNAIPTPLEEASLFIIAATFALIGVAVFVIANDTITSSAVLINATIGAILMEQLAPGIAGNPFHVSVLYLSTVASGMSFLMLCWTFPINRLKRKRIRYWATATMIPSIALMSAFMLATTRYSRLYEWLKNLSYVNHSVNLLGAVALVVVAVVRVSPEQRPARRAMRIVGLGMLASILPTLVVLIIPHFLGVRNLAPAWTATLGTVFMPISLGIAVTSPQFLGVTRLVRRGLVAIIVWLVLIALLAIAVRGFELWRVGQPPLGQENAFLSALLVALVAIVLWLAQSWLRRRAESLIFRDVYDYQETLRQLSVELVELRGLDAIANHVLARLLDVLDLAWAKMTLHTNTGTEEFWRCAAGAPDHTPPDTGGDVGSPALVEQLSIEHETIGMLALGPKRHDVTHSPEDVALVTTLAPMIATALQSALLLRRLEAQVTELVDREHELGALSGQLMQVQEEERKRLALDLHDDPLQRAILLAREISQTSPELERPRLRAEAEEIINSLRAICAGLRPPVLDDFGLVAGLESLVNEARARSELNIVLNVETFEVPEFGRLEPELETALYRVSQEALNNCIKHASATTVEVVLRRSPDCVNLDVIDNGQGVTADNGFTSDSIHLGLLGIRERLQPWGGNVKIESSEPCGTTVSIDVPLRGEHE